MKNGISGEELKSRHSEEVEELHRQLKDKEKILLNYRSEHGQLEVFFNRVLGSITPKSPLESIFSAMKLPSRVDSEIAAVLHVTDSHMGEVQEADEIEGFNEYSPEICDERNITFIKRSIDWINLHRANYKINKCHVLMTGDLISGDIHDELMVTNAFPAPEQVVRAAQIHAKQIALLAPHCENVIVEFISEDNHARLTRKPQAKEAGKNTFNYLVGRMIVLTQ